MFSQPQPAAVPPDDRPQLTHKQLSKNMPPAVRMALGIVAAGVARGHYNLDFAGDEQRADLERVYLCCLIVMHDALVVRTTTNQWLLVSASTGYQN